MLVHVHGLTFTTAKWFKQVAYLADYGNHTFKLRKFTICRILSTIPVVLAK
uniref:Uncharacterized protein n=1 Tax=Anguilla anguilla TaxID=7936 RepID=A0A0E9TQ28_ANGAN